jgi:hypothetical protein
VSAQFAQLAKHILDGQAEGATFHQHLVSECKEQV